MILTRAHDWPTRLMAQFLSVRGRPFAWGESDCCLFACDCIQAMTGVDPAAWFRGRYSTRLGALRKLREFAGAGLEATVERLAMEHGLPEINPLSAQRGDLALIAAPECPPEGLALAVCAGQRLAARGRTGLTMMPLARALRAWRV